MVNTTSPSAAPVRGGPDDSSVSMVPAGREAAVRRRRRPGLWAAGAALVAVGGLGSAALAGQAGDRVDVLAVARAVPVGQAVGEQDLTVARVAADPGLRPVPASERARVVGRVAVVGLQPGSLLTADAVTDAAVPGRREQVVGVGVRPGQMPAGGLAAGDRVLLVPVPGDQPEAASSAGGGAGAVPSGKPVQARVVQVGAADVEGRSTVDLLVREDVGPRVAALGSTGRVALVLVPAGG